MPCLLRASCGYAALMMKQVAAAIALLAAPATLMSGCANQSSDKSTTSSTSGSTSSAQTLTTQLNAADGKHVADATVDFTKGYATVTIETIEAGILSPGFHGLHIHAVGKCEANSVAPSGGQSADFASAGDHFQAPSHTGQPASGDLPPLLVRSDGSGKLVATSDGFTIDQLKGAEGSSIVLHQGADVGATTAESDQRIACGVLSPAGTTSTSVSTSISTSVVTTTATTVPPSTVTETPASTAPASTTSVAPSTSTSTVTVIQPTLPPITVPQLPGPNGG
jgi:Cu-Zn family superoxide dismutase